MLILGSCLNLVNLVRFLLEYLQLPLHLHILQLDVHLVVLDHLVVAVLLLLNYLLPLILSLHDALSVIVIHGQNVLS